MSDNKIVISLDRGDYPDALPENELLQRDAYEKAKSFLDASLSEASSSANNDEDERRVHNTIFVDGPRGAGKTAFILSLRKLVPSKSDNKDSFYFFKPIDPTLLNDDENFINIIVALMHDEVKDKLDKNKSIASEYWCALEGVAQALEGMEKKDQSPGMERIMGNRDGLGLHKHLNKYYNEICKILGCKLLVLLIDDADMAPEWTYRILETIRRHLSFSCIVPVVTGDLDQYSHIVKKKFNESMNKDCGNELAYNDISSLGEKYLEKVLPTHRRIKLLSVEDHIKNRSIHIEWRKTEISLRGYFLFVKHLIYRGVNGAENSHPDFHPENTRALIQMLQTTGPTVFENCGKDLGKISDQSESIEIEAREIVVKLQYEKDSGYSTLLKLLKCFKDYWSSAGRLADYHRAEADIWLIEAFLGKHPVSEWKEQIYFNPLKQEGLKGSCPWSEIALSGMRKTNNNIPEIKFDKTLSPFPPIEPYSKNAVFTKRSLKNINHIHKTLLHIFSYNNYYNDYQTVHMIYFGRAFDLMVQTLIGKITHQDIKNVMAAPPFFSFYHMFSECTINEINISINEEQDDDEEQYTDQESDEIDDSEHDYLSFHAMYNNSDINLHYPPSAQIVQLAINKAFNGFGKMKTLSSDDNLMNGDSIYKLIERFILVTANSFATFEKDIFQGDVAIAKQNIAISENIRENLIAGKNMNSDAVYRINISPVSSTNSITSSIINGSFLKTVKEYFKNDGGHPKEYKILEINSLQGAQQKSDSSSKNRSEILTPGKFWSTAYREYISRIEDGKEIARPYFRDIGDYMMTMVNRKDSDKYYKFLLDRDAYPYGKIKEFFRKSISEGTMYPRVAEWLKGI